MTSRMTLSQAFRQGVQEEMEANDGVFVMGTDLFIRGGHFGQVLGLGESLGHERIRDTPISEAAMVSLGVGAAAAGLRPIIDLNFIDFSLGAMDEIVNQAAKHRYMTNRAVPLVIRGTSGIAAYAAQHNNSLEGFFASVPGLVVVTPSEPNDARGLIRTAIQCDDPVVFLMHKRLTGKRGDVSEAFAPEHFEIGQARVRREGVDVTLIGFGITVDLCLEAASSLQASSGVDCEVVDLRYLYPLDQETVAASVMKTGRAVVVTEEPCFGGVGAEIAARVQQDLFAYLDAPVDRIALPRSPIPHAPNLIDSLRIKVDDVSDAVLASRQSWPSTPLNV